jgi:hypothetical protein
MIRVAGKKWLSCFGDLDKFIWKIRKKKLKKKSSCKVLQAFVRMRNIAMLWHISLKKIFGLFYFPDAKSSIIANRVLKKNRHRIDLRFKIADLIVISKTFLNESLHDII